MEYNIDYIGANGDRAQFGLDDIPQPGTRAASLLSMQPIRMPDFVGGGSFAPLINAPEHNPKLAAFLGSLDNFSNRANEKQKIDETELSEILSRKVSSSGSIEMSGGGLQLKGDSSAGGGNKFYGSIGGSRGFFDIAVFDPPGRNKGLTASGDYADGDSAFMNGFSGCIVPIGSRIDAKIDNSQQDFDRLIVKEFSRVAHISPNGRVYNVSSEHERVVLDHLIVPCEYSVMCSYEYDDDDTYKEHPTAIRWMACGPEPYLHGYQGEYQDSDGLWWGKFEINELVKKGKAGKITACPVKVFHLGEGGIDGMFNVMPFWTGTTTKQEHPVLNKLAFGSDANLMTWNESEKKFECNYDPDTGEMLDNPPVKIVTTDICPYG